MEQEPVEPIPHGRRPIKPLAPRPPLIAAVCVIGIFCALVTHPLLYTWAFEGTAVLAECDTLFLLMSLFLSLAGIVALIGIWSMKKWGLYLYALVSLSSIAYGLTVQIPWISGYLVPLVIAAVGFAHFRKMT